MTKRMLADILWEAANERLNPVRVRFQWGQFSCCAAADAELGGEGQSLNDSQAVDFLRQLGCHDHVKQNPAWKWAGDDEVQGVRYMWLLLAMHVAEDEGIEVEVSR